MFVGRQDYLYKMFCNFGRQAGLPTFYVYDTACLLKFYAGNTACLLTFLEGFPLPDRQGLQEVSLESAPFQQFITNSPRLSLGISGPQVTGCQGTQALSAGRGMEHSLFLLLETALFYRLRIKLRCLMFHQKLGNYLYLPKTVSLTVLEMCPSWDAVWSS